MAAPVPLLQLRNISVRRGQREIIREFNLTVSAGNIILLTGRNGAGKSTLLQAIAGLLPLAAGEVLFSGLDVSGWPSHRRLARNMTYLPQGGQIFPNMTVSEHYRILTDRPGRGHERSAGYTPAWCHLLFPELVGKTHQVARLLSGGERAMLALSLALTKPAPLMLLDEPTNGLAAQIRPTVFAYLRDLVTASQSTALIAEHDLITARCFASWEISLDA